MIEHSLDTAHSILHLRLKSAIEQGTLRRSRRRSIRTFGNRRFGGRDHRSPGIPGWESFERWWSISVLCAIITSRSEDRPRNRFALGNVAEHLASHFCGRDQAVSCRGRGGRQTMGNDSTCAFLDSASPNAHRLSPAASPPGLIAALEAAALPRGRMGRVVEEG